MKVHIGSRYVRPWFEVRRSDGYFAAFKPQLGRDALLLQEALISTQNRRRESRIESGVSILLIVLASIVSAIVITQAFI